MSILNEMLNLFMADYKDLNKLEKFKKIFFDHFESYSHSQIKEMNFMNLIILLSVCSSYFTQKRIVT